MPVTPSCPTRPRRALSRVPAGPRRTSVVSAGSDEQGQSRFMGDVSQCALHPDLVQEQR